MQLVDVEIRNLNIWTLKWHMRSKMAVLAEYTLAQSNRDWKSKNDGHQKADREWENNKGMMTPPAPPADPVSMVAPPANLRVV